MGEQEGSLRDFFLNLPQQECFFCHKRIGGCQNIRHDDDGKLILEDGGASCCADCATPMHPHCGPFWSPGDASAYLRCGRPECRGSSGSASQAPPTETPAPTTETPAPTAPQELPSPADLQRFAESAVGPNAAAGLEYFVGLVRGRTDCGDLPLVFEYVCRTLPLLQAFPCEADASALLSSACSEIRRGCLAMWPRLDHERRAAVLRGLAMTASQQMKTVIDWFATTDGGRVDVFAEQLNHRVRTPLGILSTCLKTDLDNNNNNNSDNNSVDELLHDLIEHAALLPFAQGFRLPFATPSWETFTGRMLAPALTLLNQACRARPGLLLRSFAVSVSNSNDSDSNNTNIADADDPLRISASLFLLASLLSRIDSNGLLKDVPVPAEVLPLLVSLIDAGFGPLLRSLSPNDHDMSAPPRATAIPLLPALQALVAVLLRDGRHPAVERFFCAALLHDNLLVAQLALRTFAAVFASSPFAYQHRLVCLLVSVSQAVAAAPCTESTVDRWSAALSVLLTHCLSPDQNDEVIQALSPRPPTADTLRASAQREGFYTALKQLRILRLWSTAWLPLCNQLVAELLQPFEQQACPPDVDAPPRIDEVLACLDSLLAAASRPGLSEDSLAQTCETVLLVLSVASLRNTPDVLRTTFSLAGRLSSLLCQQPETYLFPLLGSCAECLEARHGSSSSSSILLLIERVAETLSSLEQLPSFTPQFCRQVGGLYTTLLADTDWLARCHVLSSFYRFAAALPTQAFGLLSPQLNADFIRYLSKKPLSITPTMLDPSPVLHEDALRRALCRPQLTAINEQRAAAATSATSSPPPITCDQYVQAARDLSVRLAQLSQSPDAHMFESLRSEARGLLHLLSTDAASWLDSTSFAR